jgi:hypothetical protein
MCWYVLQPPITRRKATATRSSRSHPLHLRDRYRHIAPLAAVEAGQIGLGAPTRRDVIRQRVRGPHVDSVPVDLSLHVVIQRCRRNGS